jgi:hypothetical protein
MSPIPETINPNITAKTEGNTFEKKIRHKDLPYRKGTKY